MFLVTSKSIVSNSNNNDLLNYLYIYTPFCSLSRLIYSLFNFFLCSIFFYIFLASSLFSFFVSFFHLFHNFTLHSPFSLLFFFLPCFSRFCSFLAFLCLFLFCSFPSFVHLFINLPFQFSFI